jgi:hypothetical protein
MYLISEEQFDELIGVLPKSANFLIGQIFKQAVHDPENRDAMDKISPTELKRILTRWLAQNELLDQSIGLIDLAKDTKLLLDQLEK